MNVTAFVPRGMALPVALILLVVLTLLALSGIRLSTMELRIALNDELRVNAFEQAQSMVDAAVRDFTNTPILADAVTICARATVDPPCSGADVQVTLPAEYNDALNVGQYVNVIIRGIPPIDAEPPVGTGYSLTSFNAAYLQATGEYDRNDEGLGRARVHEGIAVVYGDASGITTRTGTQANNEYGGVTF